MYLTPYITLLILILGFTIQWIFYKNKFLLHPSFWFFAFWILSLISFIIFINAGFDFIISRRDLIIELFNYVSFTALSFVFVSILSFRRIRENYVNWNPVFHEDLFKIISTVILVVVLLSFFITAGTNIVENRQNMILQQRTISERGSVSFVQMFLGIILGFNTPLLILSGYLICNSYVRNGFKISLLKAYYFFPFVTGLLRTISEGGRAGILTTLECVAIGIFLALFGLRSDTKKILKKLLQYGLILAVLFSFYSTAVLILRERTYDQSIILTQTQSRWQNFPLLKPFAAIIEYGTDHIVGYQFRRIDSVSPELEMGQITLSGFTMFKIPVFSQIAGTPISIQSTFDLFNPVKEIVDKQNESQAFYGITATIYLLLFDDFGYEGTFVAIFIFVFITQLIFNSLFRGKKTSFISILPLYLVSYCWFTTFFNHLIIGNWMSIYLYSFIIVDLVGRYDRYYNLNK